ncbi:hypothetical protein ARALYDRAFT_894456 [Arabidopsis lyrata subsp. lyrata]|uniref:Zinc-finger domain-containing protein n=1 Tax=Arabidopsis lyrata subsp. lyrata TaxID=81972 RepID=D7KV13_ARALL|nr:hypothetical protein ARALYDRAFT_894456 [Arabidopsis lyrata subsp. lyrata]
MARKRQTNPGVRIIGRRIYDSKNGKSCHQCRQKTLDFAAPCKTMKKNKLCPIKFCYKCLSNSFVFFFFFRSLTSFSLRLCVLLRVFDLNHRYGENAEEVAKLDDWKCPLCRGICICSVCMSLRQSRGLMHHWDYLQSMNFLKLKGMISLLIRRSQNWKKAKSSDKLKEEIQFEAQLPQGISLTCVSGIDIPAEEAGNVCQLFEFCSAFGKVLALKEEHAETIVRELFICGGCYCVWNMNASRKLKLLNFLCDESLSTWAMRNYIKSQTRECGEQKKEAKEKASAAKEKEKELKQMLQGEEKNGAPLFIEEHKSVVSQIRDEAKKAHEEMIEAKGMKSGMTLICDARRTEPIMLDDNGFVFWKLKCFEEEQIFLLQDLGTFDDLCPHEKWLTFKPEQKPEIEKYISSKRRKLMRTQKKANAKKNANAKKECK